jgi:hypothetical protein
MLDLVGTSCCLVSWHGYLLPKVVCRPQADTTPAVSRSRLGTGASDIWKSRSCTCKFSLTRVFFSVDVAQFLHLGFVYVSSCGFPSDPTAADTREHNHGAYGLTVHAPSLPKKIWKWEHDTTIAQR